jgi:hypothetical protein
MRLRSTALTVTLVALSGLGLSAATASAVTLGHAGGLKYVRTTTSLPLAAFDEKQARCGGSWHVFGGGAQLSGPTISGQLESIAPFDSSDANALPDDGWLGAASNLGSVPLTLKTYAICSHENAEYGDITIHTENVDSISGGGVICNGPPWTVGGGIQSFTAPGDTHLLDTLPPPTTPQPWAWEASSYHDAGPEDGELRVHAICTPGVDLAWRHRSEEAESTPGPLSATADCPAGTHVTGGGILADVGSNVQAASSWIADSRPLDDNDPGQVPDDGWTGSVQLAAGAGGADAYAVCVDP